MNCDKIYQKTEQEEYKYGWIEALTNHPNFLEAKNLSAYRAAEIIYAIRSTADAEEKIDSQTENYSLDAIARILDESHAGNLSAIDWIDLAIKKRLKVPQWFLIRLNTYQQQEITPKKEQVQFPQILESQEQRQAKRWEYCVDAGLQMPTETYKHFPRGINKIAERLGITRQALAQDLNAHRERTFGK